MESSLLCPSVWWSAKFCSSPSGPPSTLAIAASKGRLNKWCWVIPLCLTWAFLSLHFEYYSRVAKGLTLRDDPRLGTSEHMTCATSPEAYAKQVQYGEYFLTVITIFKSENAMKDWVEHHIREGVDHFLLIDNNDANDTASACNLRTFIDAGVVTLVRNSTKYIQRPGLNFLFQQFRSRSKWFMGIDADEYMYANNNGLSESQTVADVLRTLPSSVQTIHVPMKLFGTNRLVDPSSRVTALRTRKPYSRTKTIFKWIAKGEALEHYTIHSPSLKSWLDKDCARVLPDLTCVSTGNLGPSVSISSMKHSKFVVSLNHYSIPSREFVFNKNLRGSAATESHDARFSSNFLARRNESSSEMDVELLEKYLVNLVNDDVDDLVCRKQHAGGSQAPWCENTW